MPYLRGCARHSACSLIPIGMSPRVTHAALHSSGMQSDIELRHLRYFVAVAEELNFGRAAAKLQISQPPLSRQIRDLEWHVGTPLFHRGTRGVSLTDAGRAFFDEVRRILDQVPHAVRTAQRAARGGVGRLDVGYDCFTELVVLPHLREALLQRHPNLDCCFQRFSAGEQAPLLRSEDLDAALVTLPVWDLDQLTVEPLLRERAVVLLSESHTLASRSHIALKDLAGFTVTQIREEFIPAHSDPVSRLSIMCGVRLPSVRFVRSLVKLLQSVRDSQSVAVLPCSVQDVCGEGIRCLRIIDANADFTYGIAYRRDGVRTPLTDLLDTARYLNEGLVRKRGEQGRMALSG